ncbi:MAG: hypothetical protein H8E79_06025 [Desulfobulbaceae bacterium]|uniref:Uncharacterized protein n=1 Tax=Candidatus Desulfatifera sulfidica TaxID=2841691 RepID=A0A8J6NBF4_9BACT|nr:hypothetical protein [Candidatus Desulfatifera sulfidica]
METTKTLQKTQVTAKDTTGINDTLAQVTLSAFAIGGLAIGIWGFAAMIGGMINSGGPLSLAMNWFRAVNGL